MVGCSGWELELFTDATGSVGFVAFFQGRWCVNRWPEGLAGSALIRNLMLLELFPIVVAVKLWGKEFKDWRVCFHCDNMGVVHAINSLSASSLPVVLLLRHLVLRCLTWNIVVPVVDIPGGG